MPLIIIAGFPCCGKTTVAKQIQSYILNNLKIPNDRVIIVNEESENIKKSQGYKSSAAEKGTRGILKSAVNQKLSSECYVIADSLNYIKGYRYELYCSARSLRTPHCVVLVESKSECSDLWEASREDKYEPDM